VCLRTTFFNFKICTFKQVIKLTNKFKRTP
jgi:biotin carboxyl carrier protein